MPRSSFFRVLSATILAGSACAHREITGPIPLLPFAAATNSCGPADGPAVVILLSPNADVTGQDPSYPLVRIMLFDGLNAVRGKRWVLGGDSGFASWASSRNDSEPATRAVVSLDATSGNDIRGSVELTFAARGTVRGRFSATYAPRSILCG